MFKKKNQLLNYIYNNYFKKNNYKFFFNFNKDLNLSSVPWFTLPSNKFLEHIIKKKYTVFEYGSGSSTFFFSKRCKKIYSVELYREFYENFIKLKIPKNVKIFNNSNTQIDTKYKKNFYYKKYIKSIQDVKFKKKNKDYLIGHGFISKTNECINYASKILDFKNNFFDVIVIDGQARELCVKLSIHKLKKKGFIIFDNSDRIEYLRCFKFLKKNKFYRIDFWGIPNFRTYETCTSIFARKLSDLKSPYITMKKYSPNIINFKKHN